MIEQKIILTASELKEIIGIGINEGKSRAYDHYKNEYRKLDVMLESSIDRLPNWLKTQLEKE